MLHRLAALPLVVLGVVLFLIEEVLWSWLGGLMARLAALPVVARVEAWVRALPPYPAMVLFLLPVAVIFPFKLAALWLMAQGHVLLGIGCLLAAKLTGMAVLARLYALCRPSLVTLGWFSRLEATILRWRSWAHAKLDSLPGWAAARSFVRAVIEKVRSYFRHSPGMFSHRLSVAKRLGGSLWRKFYKQESSSS